MKITIEAYNPNWPIQFEQLKAELETILKDFNPIIEHVGSTSVPHLAAKPIIDILVGLKTSADLDKTVSPMLNNHFIYYETYNAVMPERRYFVGLKDKSAIRKFQNIYKEGDITPSDEIHHHKLTHIHIWEFGTSEWIRHIAFRDYLRTHPSVRADYEALKKELSAINWKDGNEYNGGKNDFIKREEAKAILWYNEGGRR